MGKRCGYSFWGYLADTKRNQFREKVSSPDGNAFYSWCIIRELQKRGYNVERLMPERDWSPVIQTDSESNAFKSWVKDDRYYAWCNSTPLMITPTYENIALHSNLCEREQNVREYLTNIVSKHIEGCEFVLHEWRMLIKGRNDINTLINDLHNWQPDYMIQEIIIDECIRQDIKLFIFDLDYKLTIDMYLDMIAKGANITILELGKKWSSISKELNLREVYIPFDFDHINDFSIKELSQRKNDLVYVGNRYERDWCIYKYIPEDLNNVTIYGNWLEGDRDSAKRWSRLKFRGRIQTGDMYSVYSNSICTILLAKREYCMHGFMTARLLESIFYGSVPLFIEEYGKDVIEEFAGDYADILTVKDKQDVKDKIDMFKQQSKLFLDVINYLRRRLKFMDVKYFVNILMEEK